MVHRWKHRQQCGDNWCKFQQRIRDNICVGSGADIMENMAHHSNIGKNGSIGVDMVVVAWVFQSGGINRVGLVQKQWIQWWCSR